MLGLFGFFICKSHVSFHSSEYSKHSKHVDAIVAKNQNMQAILWFYNANYQVNESQCIVFFRFFFSIFCGNHCVYSIVVFCLDLYAIPQTTDFETNIVGYFKMKIFNRNNERPKTPNINLSIAILFAFVKRKPSTIPFFPPSFLSLRWCDRFLFHNSLEYLMYARKKSQDYKLCWMV